jgi:hypothetical protein
VSGGLHFELYLVLEPFVESVVSLPVDLSGYGDHSPPHEPAQLNEKSADTATFVSLRTECPRGSGGPFTVRLCSPAGDQQDRP